MILSRRGVPVLGLCFLLGFLLTARNLSRQRPWRAMPQVVGMGDMGGAPMMNGVWNVSSGRTSKTMYAPQPNFVPGTPKPPGEEYTKILVVPRTTEEDTSWIEMELPEWSSAVYVADDPTAPLHPPKNKGHEVMVYLTYIIDNYDHVPDVAVFMHSHQNAWHNDAIFGGDAVALLRRLNPARVVREGYMNVRCGFAPGCPDWMHPGTMEEDEQKQEETLMARAWGELFPDDPVPSVLAQPCCAQFALSRDRIRSIPRSRFIYYRDWLLQTDLSDYIAGRIWEYLWQYVFTGQNVVCVEENVCLCDGYGFCFGGPDEFRAFQDLEAERNELQQQLEDWQWLASDIEMARLNEDLDESAALNIPQPGQDASLEKELEEKERKLQELYEAAIERGKDPKHRALEAGRPWKEGDGF